MSAGRAAVAGLAVLWLAGGCTVDFTSPGTGPDGGVDARPDVSQLADAAPIPDAARDAGIDAGPPDAGIDAGCPPGTKPCESSCVSVDSPATGCGEVSCDPCLYDHAAALCVGGSCALGNCENQWGNCDNDPNTGCETDLTSTVEHCGGCGDPCSLPNANMGCQASSCQFLSCVGDYRSCDGNLMVTGCETDTGYDDQNCGSCGSVCHTGFNCNNTACRCSSDADCDTGGGGTCDPYYHLCKCPSSFCLNGPCQADGTGCL